MRQKTELTSVVDGDSAYLYNDNPFERGQGVIGSPRRTPIGRTSASGVLLARRQEESRGMGSPGPASSPRE